MEGHAPDAAAEPYAVFFTHAPRPMWIWDRQTYTFLDVNVAAENMYGFAREEMLEMTLFDIRPPEEIPRLMERLRTDLSTDGVAWRHRRKDGSLLDAEISETTLVYHGKPARLAVITDVTEREDAWRELSRSEQRFRQIFEASPVGITIMAASQQFIDANPAFCQMLGYTRDELCARTLHDVTYAEDWVASQEGARLMFEGEQLRMGIEKRYVAKNGDVVWGSVNATSVRSPEGDIDYTVALIEDLTLRKQAEAERRRDELDAREILSQLSDREGEVMSMMSHGRTAADIARELGLSVRTVESHIAAAYRKLSVSRKEAALREYQRLQELMGEPPA
jgi:PAS domain S-box-containing protein